MESPACVVGRMLAPDEQGQPRQEECEASLRDANASWAKEGQGKPRPLPEGFESWQPLRPGGGTLSQLKTDLHIAAFRGEVERVRTILASGSKAGNTIRANAVDHEHPPLVYAVRQSVQSQEEDASRAEIVRLLIEAGADVDYLTPGGESALILAATFSGGIGKVRVCQALIEGSADLRQRDKRNKYNALHWAIVSGWYDVVELLIRSGASCTSKGGKDKQTAAELASARLLRLRKPDHTPTGPKEPAERVVQMERILQACTTGAAERCAQKNAASQRHLSNGDKLVGRHCEHMKRVQEETGEEAEAMGRHG